MHGIEVVMVNPINHNIINTNSINNIIVKAKKIF